MPNKYDGATVEFPIFDNDYKKGKQPDRRGQIEMSRALLKEMVEVGRRGETPILQLAVWENVSKKNKPYLYCRLSMDTYAMNKAKEGDTTPSTAATPEADETEDEDPF